MAIRAAEQLVSLAYVLRDLLGSVDDARGWLRAVPEDAPVGEYLPSELTADNRSLLAERLAAAGVTGEGRMDRFRVDEADQVLSLLPLIAVMEAQRRPKPRPSLACTLPAAVELPEHRRNFGRSLAVLVADALRSVEPGGQVLVSSPFWSMPGCQLLKPALQRAHTLHCPITLAGASRAPIGDSEPDYQQVMLTFGGELAAGGYEVRCLCYQPPSRGSLFHAKAVCGATGYLGSGNITAAGMESPVEIGVPLSQVDVAEVWSLVGELRLAGLLVPKPYL